MLEQDVAAGEYKCVVKAHLPVVLAVALIAAGFRAPRQLAPASDFAAAVTGTASTPQAPVSCGHRSSFVQIPSLVGLMQPPSIRRKRAIGGTARFRTRALRVMRRVRPPRRRGLGLRCAPCCAVQLS
jgi:hypothetical protein